VLEINPVSNGHTLIIPKAHAPSGEEIPKSAFNLARKLAKRIKTKLKPKEVAISSSSAFGHAIINILPIYENENLGSERKQATPEELIKLRKLLETKKRKVPLIKKTKPKVLKSKDGETFKLPKRIP
jgi:diadenosine tetraphosphate (Ap4A) HIT family hydrolase